MTTIRIERLKLRLTLSEFAEIIGITRQSLSLYEKEKSTPNVIIARKIADFFEVDISEFQEFNY